MRKALDWLCKATYLALCVIFWIVIMVVFIGLALSPFALLTAVLLKECGERVTTMIMLGLAGSIAVGCMAYHGRRLFDLSEQREAQTVQIEKEQ